MRTIIESLVASDYEFRMMERSKIDPTKEIVKSITYTCPKCKENLGSLSHDQPTSCRSCGLIACIYGNSLQCEIKEE